MKKMLLSAAAFAVVAVSAVAVMPTTSEAVPAFARQTGAACLSCHFQSIPKLAAFGRNFSLNGMRDMGEGSLIEDDALSLPAAFNASFLMKFRFANNDTDTPYGVQGASFAIQYPDETALLFGGRYGEHFGGLTEFSIMPDGGAGIAQSKTDYIIDLDSGVIGIAAFSGDLGAGWAFNDPSNAVRHNTRSSQMRAGALNETIMMHNGISGLGAYLYLNDSIYAALGLVTPAGLDAAQSGADLGQLSPYVRVAYIAEVAGFEAVVGGWYASLNPAISSGTDAATNDVTRDAESATQAGIDIQLQGEVGDLSVGFYLPIVLVGEQVGNISTNYTGAQAMANVAMGHMGVRLGYDYKVMAVDGADDVTTDVIYLGAWYSLAQNLELDLGFTSTSVDDGREDTTATQLEVEYVY